MKKLVSRRQLLKRLGAAGSVSLVTSRSASSWDPAILVTGRPIEIAVSQVSAETVRIIVLPIQDGRVQPVPQDGSLVHPAWNPPRARLRRLVREERVQCGNVVVKLSPDPLAVHVETRDGRLVQHLRLDSQTGSLSFLLGDQPLLGLGQGGPQFDRRGSSDRMRSGQSGYMLRTHGGRLPIQWLIGTGGWAMFIHHPSGAFDFSGQEGRFDPGSPDTALPLDLFIVASRDPAQVMAEYARLTGLPQMPPLWSLGYQQSHRTLASREEILSVARTFREKQLPCDSLIYLGTGFCPSGWNTGHGSFTFNSSVFPDPRRMIEELHALSFRIVLHVVIQARELRGTVQDRFDMEKFEEKEAASYWNQHRKVFALGVGGWWPDEGDPLNAASRLTRNRMYWEGPQLDRPNERPFALHRNGHAGMQRYGAFLWSGDVYSTWETLRTHVPVAINTGLSGIPYWGTDIGGFVPTKEYTGELHVRWFQFGAFCPLFRSHGRTWHLRLPWGWNTGELGPDEVKTYTGGAANPDPSELHNADVEPICRKYLDLRYRLLPYLYTAIRESHGTGLPVMRALWLHYSGDPAAVARGDEYLWGRDMLVAPVTEKGATSRTLYLPRGTWYDFWTEEKLEGGREIRRSVDLATMPLYVRAGAILPMGPVKQYTGEKTDAPVTLRIYPGANAAFTLYEDDGISFNYRKGDWMGIQAAWEDNRRRLTLRLAEGSRLLPPGRHAIEARVVAEKEKRAVTFEGRRIEVQL